MTASAVVQGAALHASLLLLASGASRVPLPASSAAAAMVSQTASTAVSPPVSNSTVGAGTRVLLIDGAPRWEYRHLKNTLLRQNPGIELQVFLCLAGDGFRQESSPHLPPLRELPRTRQELSAYHVVLLGDVAPEQLGNEQQRNAWIGQLVEFVAFGGGLGLLCGATAMPERYRGTLLENVIPVLLEPPDPARPEKPKRERPSSALRRVPPFTPVVQQGDPLHEIARLSDDATRSTRLWQRGLPSLLAYYPVQCQRPGCAAVLIHPRDRSRQGPRPLAVAGSWHRGRTFFLATDETWRWRSAAGEAHHQKFWGNVVRYLAGGAAGPRRAGACPPDHRQRQGPDSPAPRRGKLDPGLDRDDLPSSITGADGRPGEDR